VKKVKTGKIYKQKSVEGFPFEATEYPEDKPCDSYGETPANHLYCSKELLPLERLKYTIDFGGFEFSSPRGALKRKP
jgi:hypothetical protein